MTRLRIEGGHEISGTVKVRGNKNAVLPMIAASLLTDEAIILHNVPNILDVSSMLDIAASLGVEIRRDNTTLYLRAGNIKTTVIPAKFCSSTRSSFLFSGPLLARCGSATICAPGGDMIGRRRLDAHFYGLASLGAKVDGDSYPLIFETSGLQGRELFFDEASVTATEHVMMAAVLARGTTIIRNAAAEPHVQDLAELLILMGADISGVGTNTIIIQGKETLSGADFTISGDHIEAASYLIMSAVTGGSLTLEGVSPKHFWMQRRVFEKFGIGLSFENDEIILPPRQKLEITPDFGNAIPVISDGPWPQYPSDMMSCTIVMGTQAAGTTLFFEKMFESRLYFVDMLISMGANAIVCDPHRVVIAGPSKLRGMEISSPDIRAGMAMVIAATVADGVSIINNAEVIYRGYDSVVDTILDLGGVAEKIK